MFNTIISAERLLAERIPSWVLLDCRFSLDAPEQGEHAYRNGHLPDAHYLNLDYHLSGTKTGDNGRHPLPDGQRLAVDLGAQGISADTQVIIYDDAAGIYAARAWWLLRWLGHESVAVLDGGLAAYLAAGGQLDTEPPKRHTRLFNARAALAHAVTVDEVVDNLTSDAFTVVDARAAERYRGQNETLDPIGGHIPGAKNRFFRDNLDQNSCFKSPEQLRHDWLQVLGTETESDTVVHQCGSGVSACVNLLAMEVAGLGGSRLYPGSWSEWCADRARPIAVG